MSFIINKFNGSTTAAAGTATAVIRACHSIGKQIIVEPSNDTTQYDVSLTDQYNIVVWEKTDIEGTLNNDINLPTVGNFILTISNSSVLDESFNYQLSLQEN